MKPGTRITAPNEEGDRIGTVRAVEGRIVYVHWDGDGPDVVGSAPLSGCLPVDRPTRGTVSRERKVTYNGVPAIVWEVRRSGGPDGERVALTEWLGQAGPANGGHPAGTTVLRHMQGDGRTADWTLFAQSVQTGLAHSDATVLAAGMLGVTL